MCVCLSLLLLLLLPLFILFFSFTKRFVFPFLQQVNNTEIPPGSPLYCGSYLQLPENSLSSLEGRKVFKLLFHLKLFFFFHGQNIEKCSTKRRLTIRSHITFDRSNTRVTMTLGLDRMQLLSHSVSGLCLRVGFPLCSRGIFICLKALKVTKKKTTKINSKKATILDINTQTTFALKLSLFFSSFRPCVV